MNTIFKRYTRILCASIFLMSIFIISLNVIVDPFDIYRIVKINGFNEFKPKYESHARFAKRRQIERNGYERVAFGTSRVLIGMPVEENVWGGSTKRNFNAGLSGLDMQTLYDFIIHTLKNSNPKEFLIGLDFFTFNALKQSSLDVELIDKGGFFNLNVNQFLQDFSYAAFSPQSVQATAKTLKRQRAKDHKTLATGQSNPVREEKKSKTHGYPKRFKKFEEDMVNHGWSTCAENRYVFSGDGYDTFQIFGKMIREILKHDVKVGLYISPIHARLLEHLDASGLWNIYEDWKVGLVEEVEAINKEYSTELTLWDFSGYTDYTTEGFPSDSSDAMEWYIDSSHFNSNFGGLIQKVVWKGYPESGIGVRLDSESVVGHLDKTRQDQKVYRSQHTEQYSNIKRDVGLILEEKRNTARPCSF